MRFLGKFLCSLGIHKFPPPPPGWQPFKYLAQRCLRCNRKRRHVPGSPP